MTWDRDELRDFDKDARRVGWRIAKWITAAVVLVALLSIGWVKFVSPTLIDAEAEIFRESHQYVEAERTFMLQKLSAIREIEAEIAESIDPAVIVRKEAQIKAFTREITERVELIDRDEVPQSVLDYLEEVNQQ